MNISIQVVKYKRYGNDARSVMRWISLYQQQQRFQKMMEFDQGWSNFYA